MKTLMHDLLLVEDSPYDAELTLGALRQNNLANNLYHVEDGVEALDFLHARGAFADRADRPLPSVILLDLKMPRMNGLEVLEKIRADERTRTVPVIVLTSSSEDPDIIKCYELGVNSYIVKPVDFSDFMRVVKDIGLYWMLLNTYVR